MMEFKPGKGYSSGGYTDPKKTNEKRIMQGLLLLTSVFGLAAWVLGWWSILFDAGIIIYLTMLGRKYNKEKGLDK